MTGTNPSALVDHERQNDDPAIDAGTAALAERVQRIVDALPPPSPAQRARIAALLAPDVTAAARDGQDAA